MASGKATRLVRDFRQAKAAKGSVELAREADALQAVMEQAKAAKGSVELAREADALQAELLSYLTGLEKKAVRAKKS